MLTFDPSKQKKLKFNVEVQGIDPTLLEYNLRLSDGSIEYGIRGKNNNNQIEFSVPALSEIVNYSNLYNLNEIKLEVTDKNNKYYLNPFKDNIKVKKEMKLEAKLDEEENNEPSLSINADLTEDGDRPKEPDQPPKIDQVNKQPNPSTKKFKKFLGE